MEIVDYSKALAESVNVLKECFKKYSLDQIFVAFNGGKDCTVLLDLIMNVLSADNNCDIKLLLTVYIQPENPFEELEEFIYEMKENYGINLVVIPGNIKQALDVVLKDNENIKACLMGTRRSDPYSEHLNFFNMTDPNWPQIMRVSPLLNWSYQEIWSYLIDREVSYCKLYDLGYTSLGNRLNTCRNPFLKVLDSSDNIDTYRPAFCLKDSSKERDGRTHGKKQ